MTFSVEVYRNGRWEHFATRGTLVTAVAALQSRLHVGCGIRILSHSGVVLREVKPLVAAFDGRPYDSSPMPEGC